MPLHEGKTTSGQMEIVQLYHRISMVFEDLAPAGKPLMR